MLFVFNKFLWLGTRLISQAWPGSSLDDDCRAGPICRDCGGFFAGLGGRVNKKMRTSGALVTAERMPMASTELT